MKIDAKTRLQEFSLKEFKVLPVYKLIASKGPNHKPIFKIKVKIKNSEAEFGIGSSKKIAEQNAANKLLKKIDLIWLNQMKDFYSVNLNTMKIL